MKLVTDDRFFWVSADGYNKGRVVRERKGLNGANELIDWVDVEYVNRYGKTQTITMPNTTSYLQMMKVGVL